MNIILFSRLDDCGLILRTILEVSLPSVCSIFRSGPSTPDCLSTDQSSDREESFSNTGRNNSGGPMARWKKADFEEDIGEFEVQLPPPTAMWKLPR